MFLSEVGRSSRLSLSPIALLTSSSPPASRIVTPRFQRALSQPRHKHRHASPTATSPANKTSSFFATAGRTNSTAPSIPMARWCARAPRRPHAASTHSLLRFPPHVVDACTAARSARALPLHPQRARGRRRPEPGSCAKHIAQSAERVNGSVNASRYAQRGQGLGWCR